MCVELLGVVGPTVAVVVAVREVRAVSGVGALINDFLGVSFSCLLRLLVNPIDEDEAVLVVDGSGLGRLPAVTKGWRIAACGFIRLSGSQTRHLDMKSTNSSSLHRST